MPEVMSIEVDEEFDPRPPSNPFGLRDSNGNLNWGMIAGIVIAVILVLALIFVVVNPFKSDPKPFVSKWKPTDPTQNAKFLDSYPATDPMVRSVQNSLDDWATFYTTGKLDGLVQSFDLAGNQYAKLVSEQPSVAASPEPGSPAIIELGPIGKVSRNENIFTVRVVIKWTKPGQEGKTYNWDIDMKSKESIYLLNTVRETNPKDKQPVNFCGAVDLVGALDSDKTVSKETGPMLPQQQFDSTKSVIAIRLKTWEILQSAVDGTDSEEDVSNIVGYYKDLNDVAQRVSSLGDLKGNQSDADISANRQSIEARAQSECGTDISLR